MVEVQTSCLASNYNIYIGIAWESGLYVWFVYDFQDNNLKWSEATYSE